MNGVNGNMNWSSKETVNLFSCSKDEVEIIKEGDIDDDEEEPHMETPLLFVYVEPIHGGVTPPYSL